MGVADMQSSVAGGASAWGRADGVRYGFGLGVAVGAVAAVLLAFGSSVAVADFGAAASKGCVGTTLIGDQMKCLGSVQNKETDGNTLKLTSIVDTVTNAAAGPDTAILMDATHPSIGL